MLDGDLADVEVHHDLFDPVEVVDRHADQLLLGGAVHLRDAETADRHRSIAAWRRVTRAHSMAGSIEVADRSHPRGSSPISAEHLSELERLAAHLASGSNVTASAVGLDSPLPPLTPH